MEKVVRDLKETAQGTLSQYSSIAHTIQFDDLNGNRYVYYLYNADDSTFNSTYSESTYDLRRANTVGGWTEITYDEFESSFGNWTDGGADCDRYTGGTFGGGRGVGSPVMISVEATYTVVVCLINCKNSPTPGGGSSPPSGPPGGRSSPGKLGCRKC
jgi:hypothetical protein